MTPAPRLYDLYKNYAKCLYYLLTSMKTRQLDYRPLDSICSCLAKLVGDLKYMSIPSFAILYMHHLYVKRNLLV